MTEESWPSQLKRWMDENLEGAKTVRNKFPNATIHGWLRGGINLDKLKVGTRAFLYKTTDLGCFNFEGYVDPDTIDVERAAVEKDFGRVVIWLGYHEITKQKLAEDSKVHKETVSVFLQGSDVKDEIRNRLLGQIRKYASADRDNESVKQGRTLEAATENRENYGLDELAGRVDALRRDVQGLGGTYKPTPQERREIVIQAIDAIYTQLDQFYCGASQAERTTLADSLDVQKWGWVTNILGGITKKDGMPETFARGMRPESRRRE